MAAATKTGISPRYVSRWIMHKGHGSMPSTRWTKKLAPTRPVQTSPSRLAARAGATTKLNMIFTLRESRTAATQNWQRASFNLMLDGHYTVDTDQGCLPARPAHRNSAPVDLREFHRCRRVTGFKSTTETATHNGCSKHRAGRREAGVQRVYRWRSEVDGLLTPRPCARCPEAWISSCAFVPRRPTTWDSETSGLRTRRPEPR